MQSEVDVCAVVAVLRPKTRLAKYTTAMEAIQATTGDQMYVCCVLCLRLFYEPVSVLEQI